jgi:homoserine O-succinyltransferase
MPIITPENDPGLFQRLEQAGAAVLTQEAAQAQDIRPARIGILNLMPATAMEATELQWLKNISHTVLQVEPVLLRFDDDHRTAPGSSRAEILKRYTTISEVEENGLDGLIVTGDNLELDPSHTKSPRLLPFDQIKYAEQLRAVVNWADKEVKSTIYSCLASHFMLDHIYGLRRDTPSTKFFGVYDHTVNHDSTDLLIAGMDDVLRSPHSRWGNVPVEQIARYTDLEVLAVSEQVGWLILSGVSEYGNRRRFYQGHPEYDTADLQREHERDAGSPAPENYYHPITGQPQLTWANDRTVLHANFINDLYRNYS